MLDTQTVKTQLEAAHGALKAAMALIETLYGALEVSEQSESHELKVEDVVALDDTCRHDSFQAAAVMGQPDRKICRDCGEEFHG